MPKQKIKPMTALKKIIGSIYLQDKNMQSLNKKSIRQHKSASYIKNKPVIFGIIFTWFKSITSDQKMYQVEFTSMFPQKS